MKPFVKLFRRVLPKSTQTVDEKTDKENRLFMEQTSIINTISEIDRLDPSSSSSATDMKSLEHQIENLKGLVEMLKGDIENKEINIAKLAREKEKLSLDLLKQKRSNSNIVKQLEEERQFYFQEKEIYCQEMNEIKELKKNFSKSNTSLNEKSSRELRNEIVSLKEQLKQTLETNYNLSIKFLRIKNTKSFLRNELIKTKIDHERIFSDLKAKIEMMAAEVEDLVNHKSHLYVSPSNRNYVQLVRQNSSLVHENLCLQMQIDRLNSQFDKIKLKYTKSETNSRLKYIHSSKSEGYPHCKHGKKDKRRVRISAGHMMLGDEKPEKKMKSSLKAPKGHPTEVIKIFERSKSADTPAILIINEEENKNYNKNSEDAIKDHYKVHKKDESYEHLYRGVEETPIKQNHYKHNIIETQNKNIDKSGLTTLIGKSNGDATRKNRHKKKSRRQPDASLNPEESQLNMKYELDSKKDSSHKSCIIKLAPIAEMDEIDNAANKN